MPVPAVSFSVIILFPKKPGEDGGDRGCYTEVGLDLFFISTWMKRGRGWRGEGTKIKDSQRDPNKQLPDLKIHREEKQVFYGITCRIAARVNRAVWGILHRITADDF